MKEENKLDREEEDKKQTRIGYTEIKMNKTGRITDKTERKTDKLKRKTDQTERETNQTKRKTDKSKRKNDQTMRRQIRQLSGADIPTHSSLLVKSSPSPSRPPPLPLC